MAIDPNTAAYYKSVQAEDFSFYLQQAQDKFNDQDIEKSVAQMIHDRDLGVKREDVKDSYRAVDSLIDAQEAKYGMEDEETKTAGVTEEETAATEESNEEDYIGSAGEDAETEPNGFDYVGFESEETPELFGPDNGIESDQAEDDGMSQ